MLIQNALTLWYKVIQCDSMYKVIVVEQMNVTRRSPFNRGRLYNTAVRYVMDKLQKEKHEITCFVLHDLELIPADDSVAMGETGDYKCRLMPWHLSRNVKVLANGKDFKFRKYYAGGVLSVLPAHFLDANGFSNMFSGWGADEVIRIIFQIHSKVGSTENPNKKSEIRTTKNRFGNFSSLTVMIK
jgi:hypothetical protein